MMAGTAIFAPMGALAALTFAVLMLVPFARARAVRRGEVNIGDYRLGESGRVPDATRIANRNYMNLLELPVLFYVVCLMAFVAGRVDTVALALAWGFVGARAAHSLVHLTTNNVMHRLAAFATGNVVLAASWIWFFAGHR